jgi:hypothetical protein
MNDKQQEQEAGGVKKQFKRVKISVTQEEIDQAAKANSHKCMVHQAIRRDHPQWKNVWVDKNQIRFTDPDANVIYTFQMSALGKTMILLWDAGEKVQPFDMWLRNPVVRERRLNSNGMLKPKGQEDSAREHLGPVRRPRTKRERALSGKDRVYGAKLWTDELNKVRKLFVGEPETAS